MTIELRATETGASPSPWWSWIKNVSGAMRVGSKRVLVGAYMGHSSVLGGDATFRPGA
jgi:hypothetical protein